MRVSSLLPKTCLSKELKKLHTKLSKPSKNTTRPRVIPESLTAIVVFSKTPGDALTATDGAEACAGAGKMDAAGCGTTMDADDAPPDAACTGCAMPDDAAPDGVDAAGFGFAGG